MRLSSGDLTVSPLTWEIWWGLWQSSAHLGLSSFPFKIDSIRPVQSVAKCIRYSPQWLKANSGQNVNVPQQVLNGLGVMARNRASQLGGREWLSR